MKLDLLDVLSGFRVGSTVFLNLSAACQDAGIGGVDVVEEDFLGLVTWGCDAGRGLLGSGEGQASDDLCGIRKSKLTA